MKKYLENNKGWAMALVIVLLAIVPIFVVALYTYSMTSTRLVLKQIELERSRYLARAGMEATVYVWQDAPQDDKPTGTMERVYLTEAGTFAQQSTLSTDEIEKSLGYVEATITFNTDSTSQEYLTTKIVTIGRAGTSGSQLTGTSLPWINGDNISPVWYSDNTGEFYTSNGSIQKSITEPYSVQITYFELEGVVTCDAKNDDFTFQDGETGILVDTVFFNDAVDMTVGNDKVLFITAKKIIFREPVYLSSSSDYETIILHAAAANSIDVSDPSGKYGAVYFGGDVKLDGTTIIPAGSNFYYKSRTNGVDLVAWGTDDEEYTSDSTLFFPIPASGDENNFTPTETSSIYFIYE